MFYDSADVGNPSVHIKIPPVTLCDELEVNLFSELLFPLQLLEDLHFVFVDFVVDWLFCCLVCGIFVG